MKVAAYTTSRHIEKRESFPTREGMSRYRESIGQSNIFHTSRRQLRQPFCHESGT